jgi:hypothetical protein
MAEDALEKRNRLSAAHFANYQEYNKVLRTWFVTFGLGAPSLFLINGDLAKTLDKNPWHTAVIIAYLLGCFIQVGIAILNKTIAWHNYDDQQTEKPHDTKRHKWCGKLENEFRIDMAADIMTAVLFVAATVAVVLIFN